MSKPEHQEVDRSSPISLSDGFAILAAVERIDQEHNPDNANLGMTILTADILSKLFCRLVNIDMESLVFARALPERGKPQITLDALTSEMDAEIIDIDAAFGESPRFAELTDESHPAFNTYRLDALNLIRSYVNAAYDELKAGMLDGLGSI